QRSFDGAWRASGEPSLGILGVHEKVEKMLQPGARHQQAIFAGALLQEIDGAPEFVLADVVADDDLGTCLNNVAEDRLQTRTAAGLTEACRLVEQCLDFGGLHEAGIHVVSPFVFGSAVRTFVVRVCLSGRRRAVRTGAYRVGSPSSP